MANRRIEDILLFREDISPFLVHLTKDFQQTTSKEILNTILNGKVLKAGNNKISFAQYGGYTTEKKGFNEEKNKIYFGAICFTETPLNETHCLLEIAKRKCQLSPYGIVFLKDNLKRKGVSPVIYINNESGDQDKVIRALFSLIESHPDESKLIIPLISVFGKKLQHPGGRAAQTQALDFMWEREWRRPPYLGDFAIDFNDIFIGLCPEEDTDSFEKRYPPIKFIDPRRNIKWYATKLIESRQRLDLKYSVV